MKQTFSDRAALYRRSGDLLQAERYDRLAAEALEERIENSVLALANQIDDEPSNAELYLKRARQYFEYGETDSVEWQQAERDLTKAIEVAQSDDLLAEAYDLRSHLRACSTYPSESPYEDVKRAIHHGSTNPQLFNDLAEHYCELAGEDDLDRLGEAISLYIAGIYVDLYERGSDWTDRCGIITVLASTYEKRAQLLRRRGKPVQAFEDDEKASWLKREGFRALQEMNRDSDGIEFPRWMTAACPQFFSDSP